MVSKFPENPSWGPLYNLARHSYLLRLVNVNLVFLRRARSGSIEQTARAEDPDIAQAVSTTAELLRMMRTRAAVPVVVFSVRPDRRVQLLVGVRCVPPGRRGVHSRRG